MLAPASGILPLLIICIDTRYTSIFDSLNIFIDYLHYINSNRFARPDDWPQQNVIQKHCERIFFRSIFNHDITNDIGNSAEVNKSEKGTEGC